MRRGISFLDCPHNNVQQFTEICLDCGYNIWTTKEEYLESLRTESGSDPTIQEIRKLENVLLNG